MGTWRDPNRDVQQLPDDEFSRDLGGFTPGEPARVHDEDQSRQATNRESLPGRAADLTSDERGRLLILEPGTRLAQGSVYLDLNDLDRGAFTAIGGQQAGPTNRYVAKRDVDYELWNRLVGQERGDGQEVGPSSGAPETSHPDPTPAWPAADVAPAAPAAPSTEPATATATADATDGRDAAVAAQPAAAAEQPAGADEAAAMEAAPDAPTPTEDEAATADQAPIVTRSAVPAALRSPRNAAAAAAGFGVAVLAAVVMLVRGRRR